MKTSLLVLAAGMGSRFGGIKQMASVGSAGETVLEYSVHDALQAGFDEIVFLVRRSIEPDFRSHVLARLPARVRSRLVFQELESLLPPAAPAAAAASGRAKPWGTGHALLCAAEALDAPFAVINADDFYGRASFEAVHGFLAAADPAAAEFCMAGFLLANTTSPHGAVSRGLCEVAADGFLRGVTEHTAICEVAAGAAAGSAAGAGRGVAYLSRLPEGGERGLSGDAVVSMNLWGFTPAVFPLARPLFDRFISANASSPKAEFYLPGLVDELVAAGRATVRVLPTPEAWFGLTYREDLEDARARVAALTGAGRYPAPLWGRP
ncbi:MAG: NTP transferase domain-containing protein [Spirochaetaceae bacterium]|nr:NTP transferase domain-containing protein [Spirochaetaceae bacterium]